MSYSVQMIPELWFERLDKKYRLPTWAGAIVFGAGPFMLLTLFVISFSGPALGDYVALLLFGAGFVLVISQFAFYTARYLRREIASLLEYSRGLEGDMGGKKPGLGLPNFASIKRTSIVFVVVVALTAPLFVIGGTGSFYVNLLGEIPYLWFNFLLATFLWTFGYSMYSIYRMGKLPLQLKPYARDKTLGLKPYAKASLNSTLIYLGIVTGIVVPVTLVGTLPFEFALLLYSLYPAGLALFLLPLRSLHQKLELAKREALAKTTPRYERLVETVNAGATVSEEIANEMAVIVEIRRDIQQIHTWPFDTAVLVRLLAVMATVLGILLSRLIYTKLIPF